LIFGREGDPGKRKKDLGYSFFWKSKRIEGEALKAKKYAV